MPNDGGKTFYDIRYKAIAPKGDDFVSLIINIEAQSQFYLSYPLIKRGVFYGSSIISGQYGTEFPNSEYQKIKKVYSIWLCRNVPKYLENTISSYDTKETIIVGKSKQQKINYDLLSVVMVYLGQPEDETQSNVLKMLNTLLSEEVPADEKIEFLQTEFGIPATEKFKEEMETMCNLSLGIEQKGIEKGMKKGIEKGDLNRAIKVAKKMIDDNFSIEMIEHYTNLSVDKIKQLLPS